MAQGPCIYIFLSSTCQFFFRGVPRAFGRGKNVAVAAGAASTAAATGEDFPAGPLAWRVACVGSLGAACMALGVSRDEFTTWHVIHTDDTP